MRCSAQFKNADGTILARCEAELSGEREPPLLVSVVIDGDVPSTLSKTRHGRFRESDLCLRPKSRLYPQRASLQQCSRLSSGLPDDCQMGRNY